ncbi:MAG: hypothetical protein QNJ12_13545 [Ilumatobacter sp.]|uniref:hypothetical protein n=1 Tax=Ilumatobacter sp. TaxID=1967498 RepID=UPI002614320F|nr:hypothetical protein [Ilumatobacter sp.]MDJ0769820.1 hypothetical protein [Ilumatobacter sp.]
MSMNRKTLERDFATPTTSPWKTFVLEAHPNGHSAGEFLTDVFGRSAVSTTDDVHLHTVRLDSGSSVVVDSLDGRFWSFHSTAQAQEMSRFLRARVTARPDLDQVWLPSAHLRNLYPGVRPKFVKTDFRGWDMLSPDSVHDLSLTARGTNIDRLLDLIGHDKGSEHAVSIDRMGVAIVDPEYGYVDEAANRFAQFVATGDSFALHQHVVSDVLARYRSFVEAAEANAIRFDSYEQGGGTVGGAPIEIALSRPLPALRSFMHQLLSSREPFRLWGLVDGDDDFVECDVVDLHVGHQLRIEASPQLIRVHLRSGCCGNSLARLVANLQHHVDGALQLVDPALNDLMTLDRRLVPAG